MTGPEAASAYLGLRLALSRPMASRPGESVRIPILRSASGKQRECKARLRDNVICGGTNTRESRRNGWICSACGATWPTKVLVEAIRGTRVGRASREREMDLAAEIGRVFDHLPHWERRVFKLFELSCEDCGCRLKGERRWLHNDVAQHLAAHHPRSRAIATPRRVAELYESACDRVSARLNVVLRAYKGGGTP